MTVSDFPELKMGKANLEIFSETLQELAQADKNILVVTSDSRGSSKLVPFGERFPQQIVEVGIAEQNLVGIAAGLASAGKKSFAVSPACFLTARALEQIKNDVAYSDNPVKLIGISAGVSYGALGSTHHSLHDFAVLRAIHNLCVVAPADNFETEQAIRAAAETKSPVYIRFGKKSMPTLKVGDPSDFRFGKGRWIRKGMDAVIIATGEAVYPAMLAAYRLEEKHGVSASVVSMHTIKPLDETLLAELARIHRALVTVEEHSIHGGLGEACAAYLYQQRCRIPLKIMGIPDEYTVTGSQVEILKHYGLSETGIADAVVELLE